VRHTCKSSRTMHSSEVNKCGVQHGLQVIAMQSSSGARQEWGDVVMIQVSNGVRMRECDIPAKAATLLTVAK